MALGGWFSGLEHHPVHQNIAGLIPIQDTCLSCGFRSSQVASGKKQIDVSHVDVCLPVCQSLSPHLSQINKNISLGEDLKQKDN